MLRFLAIAAGPRRGSGPIKAPNSGDDTALRDGPPPRTAGPIKVRAEPSISLSPASPPAQAGLRHCFDSTLLRLPRILDRFLPSSLRLRLLSASPGPRPLHPSPSLHTDSRVSFSGPTLAARSRQKQETMRQLSGGTAPRSIPPNILVARLSKRAEVLRDRSLNSSPVLLQYLLFIGFSVSVCVCPGAYPHR